MATINGRKVSVIHFGSPATDKYREDRASAALENLKKSGWIENEKDEK